MIPGNRPEDQVFENLFEMIQDDISDPNDGFIIWKLGIAAFVAAKELAAQFPHDQINDWPDPPGAAEPDDSIFNDNGED